MKRINYFWMVFLVIFFVGCSAVDESVMKADIVLDDGKKMMDKSDEVMMDDDEMSDGYEGELDGGMDKESGTMNGVDSSEQVDSVEWLNYELTDVNSGQTFTFNDFKGKPVLIESFAVWCPTCRKQQEQIKKFHEQVGDSVISVAIDTDPNEDAEAVKSHAESNGFDWRFAVSPSELTRDLINEFGVGVVNAPSAPIILICADQSYRLLDRGVKSSGDLDFEVKGCLV